MWRPTLTQPRDVRNAWWIWVAVAVGFAVLAGLTPGRRTVLPVFRQAGEHWLRGEALYRTDARDIHGFLYLPQTALVGVPLALLPEPAAESVWRLVSVLALGAGVYRLARVVGCEAGAELFPLATLLVLPPIFESARNGQPNLMLTALMLLAAADLGEQRWRRAAAWLSLGIMVKPLIVVPILLAVVVYPRVIPGLAVGLAIVMALPWACQSPAYVWEQWQGFVAKSRLSSSPARVQPTGFADGFGMLRAWGITVPGAIETWTRAGMAVMTLGWCWAARRRQTPGRAALMLAAWAAWYLMLFNPRTENNSYVVPAPAVAILAALAFLQFRQKTLGLALALINLGWALSYELTRGPNDWLSPLLALVLGGYLLMELTTARPTATVTSGASSSAAE